MNLDSIYYQNAGIGDFLFIILIFLAVIIQLISQSRKKSELAKAIREKESREEVEDDYWDNEPSGQSQDNSPSGSFFDGLEKVFVPEMPHESPTMNYDIEENKQPEPDIHNPVTSEVELNWELQKDHSALNMNQTVKVEKPILRKRNYKKEFCLKRAVIYSEILNRKYN